MYTHIHNVQYQLTKWKQGGRGLESATAPTHDETTKIHDEALSKYLSQQKPNEEEREEQEPPQECKRL